MTDQLMIGIGVAFVAFERMAAFVNNLRNGNGSKVNDIHIRLLDRFDAHISELHELNNNIRLIIERERKFL